MTELAFFPSAKRSWVTSHAGRTTAHVIGWATVGDSLLPDDALGRYFIEKMAAGQPLQQVFAALNGNFAVVIEDSGAVHLGVDSVRSIPLFYNQTVGTLAVSDDVHSLRQDSPSIDEGSATEFVAAGYVTGPHTLWRDVLAVQSGECVSWLPGESGPKAQRYFRYSCSYDSESTLEELCEQFDEIVAAAFDRVISTLNGRQAVVPLSGGLDSRLVASMFKRRGYDNVVCLSYGVQGNRDSQASREAANVLGYPWVNVVYSQDLWKESFSSAEMRDYWSFSSNGVSVPHCDDWPAMRAIHDSPDISRDAVFVPGHTGDFICGDHLKYLLDQRWHDDPSDLLGAIVKKHYSLWEDLVTKNGVRAIIKRRLEEALGGFPQEGNESVAGKYEYWEWQERQTKLIVNAIRSYEFFGFSWRIPLWDRAVVDFWQHIPISLKLEKHLYRQYLSTHDPLKIFQHEAPQSPTVQVNPKNRHNRRVRASAKARLQRIRPFDALLKRRENYRRHLREYKQHPLGLARSYGKIRFLFRDSSKRNSLSLLSRAVLREEYGIDVAELHAVRGNGVDTIGHVKARRA